MSDRLKRLGRAMVTANQVTVTILGFVLALVVGGVLMILSDTKLLHEYTYFFQHADAVRDSWNKVYNGYSAMFQGSIYNGDAGVPVLHSIESTIVDATPLVFAGLAVAVPFRAGLFNIGGQGQLIVGAIFATWVGFSWDLPTPVHVAAMLLAGMLGGALYAGIVGVLKAKTGAHEVITTIMLNYIALGLLGWVIGTKAFDDPTRSDAITKPIRSTAVLPHFSGASPQVSLASLLAVVATAVVWWLLSRTTIGFRLRAMGSNPDAARNAGVSVPRNQVYAMLIAGALMGLVAVSQVAGTLSASHALTLSVDNGIGFTGITVAMLGRGKPWGVALAALLFGALDSGGRFMEATVSPAIPHDVVTVVEAVVVICVAAPVLVQEIFRLRPASVPSAAPAAQVTSAVESAS
jgi:general nucleoside transport system permease protein